MKVLELFGGIGACSKALKNIGIETEIVDYVEIDKYAVASFNAIFNTHFEPQDICKWDKDIRADLIMHGSPCQDFSIAGGQLGGDEGSGTRSSLMYETIRIVKKIKPKYVIWENVKNILSKKHIHNFKKYLKSLEEMGYYNYYKVLNAKDYGIPQNRERVYVVSILTDVDYLFTFPKPIPLKLKLKDMLEDNVDQKYYLTKTEENIYKNKSLEQTLEQNQINNTCYIDTYNKVVDEEKARTITTGVSFRNNTFLAIKNNTKKGYLEATEGDGIDLLQPHSETRRGRVQKEMIQTIDTAGGNGKGVVVNAKTICLNSKGGRNGIEGLQPSRKDRIYDSEGIATTIATSDFYNPNYTDNLKIRKLTPKECWRLMGFSDTDFEKASKACSSAQLYKQAGNSIVVDVLMAIFKELINE